MEIDTIGIDLGKTVFHVVLPTIRKVLCFASAVPDERGGKLMD